MDRINGAVRGGDRAGSSLAQPAAVHRHHAAWWPLAGFLILSPLAQPAQVPLEGRGGPVALMPADLAVLELREPRRDLPCAVTPIDPILGFDLRHHSGYEVSVPIGELAGTGTLLRILFRVIPEGNEAEPSYFHQNVPVPSVEKSAKGDAVLYGGFDLGEGKYRVDWLMRDGRGRVCSAYWEVKVELPDKDRQIPLAIGPGEIVPGEIGLFKEEPPVVRAQDTMLHVKILANFAPQNPGSSTLQLRDVVAPVSVLRSIARNPDIAKFSLIAFNLQERRVIYRQDNADRIDFPALGEVLDSLRLGTVDVAALAEPHGDTEFLKELVLREMSAQEHPDALIFVGPKAMLEENVPVQALLAMGDLDYPVFYLNCNLDPHQNPWRDAIGHVVKFFKGAEYVITRPRDAFFAVKDTISRILVFRRRPERPGPKE